MYPLIIILGIVIILFILLYYSLVYIANQCDEARSNIETELNRRYVLIPNLVAVVKGYVSHEKYLLEQLVRLREKAYDNQNSPLSPADEAEFSRSLNRMMVRLEAYPNLKSNQNFRDLQSELANTEDRIQAALRFYNCNVRRINSAIEQFPSNIVAGLFGFEKREFFILQDTAARLPPTIRF